jgi:hypothetical protein
VLEFAGAGPEDLREGFLCVISLLSTFRSPFVTSSPLFNSASTAAGLGTEEEAVAGGAAGGGGGSGGGAAVALPLPFEVKSLTLPPYTTFRD